MHALHGASIATSSNKMNCFIHNTKSSQLNHQHIKLKTRKVIIENISLVKDKINNYFDSGLEISNLWILLISKIKTLYP